MRTKTLKNEIADIMSSGLMESAKTGNVIVCETAANNGRYVFPAEMTEELLKRAAKKAKPINLCDTSHYTQERLIYLRNNLGFLEALLLIKKSIELTQSSCVGEVDVNDIVSEVVKLNKDYRSFFKYSIVGWYSFDSKRRKVYIKQYLDTLTIVPKAWVDEIQKNNFLKLR